ncbi:MAG: family 16 glycoside hydrolase [Chloroflexota bacterium]
MFVKTLKPFVFLFVLMTVVSLACITGGDTPAPTEAPAQPAEPAQPAQPAQPAEPTPTEEPPAPAAQEFFTEEFEGDTSNWTYFTITGSNEANESGLSLETEGGYMVFDVSSKYLYTYVTYDPYEYRDVAVETFVENRGTNNNNISLFCRYSDEGWYEFNIANNGLYNILAATYNAAGDVVYNKMADGGSNKIKSGKDVNTYKIICKERTLTMYINGFETRVHTDNQYVLRDGKVGISVSSFNDLPVKVEVDWVTISQP